MDWRLLVGTIADPVLDAELDFKLVDSTRFVTAVICQSPKYWDGRKHDYTSIRPKRQVGKEFCLDKSKKAS